MNVIDIQGEKKPKAWMIVAVLFGYLLVQYTYWKILIMLCLWAFTSSFQPEGVFHEAI